VTPRTPGEACPEGTYWNQLAQACTANPTGGPGVNGGQQGTGTSSGCAGGGGALPTDGALVVLALLAVAAIRRRVGSRVEA
jgi:MYXO-CTERM domain-containing protein